MIWVWRPCPLCDSALKNTRLQNWIPSMQLEGKIKALNLVLEIEETFRSSSLEFLNVSTTEILGWMVLYCGGFPGLCRRFSRISDLYLLALSSTPQVVAIEDVPYIAKCPLVGGIKSSLVENLWSTLPFNLELLFTFYTIHPLNAPGALRSPLLTLIFLRGSFIAVLRRAWALGRTALGSEPICYSLGMTWGKPLNPFQVVSWYGLIPASQIYCKD